ncbi:hypothetical protein CC86DRAFT_398530 [Ophiobolus disseminans]|uniref:Rhodopsin domain-containing protein n=1 Tax=Ophiobolus disseminans TaxID=1469910 RepID=A0A6A6ZGS7_9PLEO|nr:hypothetical protein CC86DRAFT_398530 [Ophiobolus disseminans]
MDSATPDLSKIPAGEPPPGVRRNSINPPSLLNAVIGSTVVIQFFTLLFILIRVYVNVWTRKLDFEDAFVYAAWVGFIAQTALSVYNSTQCMSRHIWDVDVASVLKGSYRYNNIFICYTVASGLAKTAIFLQMKKIFTTRVKGLVYWVIVVSLVANAVGYTALLFLYVFTCWPREKLRDPTIPGYCMDWKGMIITMAIVNIISDVEAIIVPAWTIWQLQLATKKKLSVFAVFAVGTFAVAIGCAGVYYRVLVYMKLDTTWHLTQTSILCMAELGSVIIVGCCPYVPRLYRRRQIKSSTSSNGYGSSYDPVSSRSKARSRFQTIGDTDLRANSDVHLEMHDYTNDAERTGHEEQVSIGMRIPKTTEVTQTSEPV